MLRAGVLSCGVLLVFWIALALQAADAPSASARSAVVLTEEALKLHAGALLIDGHNDLPYQYRKRGDGSFEAIDLRQEQKKLHTDIPRLRKGGVGGQFWSAYVEAEKFKGPEAVKATLEQIDVIHELVRTYPDVFALADTADDIVRIRSQGKIACLIGVEGGHSIDNSLGVLRLYHRLGVRYMTLTHSLTLDWADSATDEPKSNGLSTFGEEVVREMNRLGMLVDISHVSPATMKHAIRVSQAPVIASHSSAYAIAQHPRNVPDDVLRLIKQKDGVVMVNFYSGFVVPEGARATQEMFKVYRELKARHKDEKELQQAFDAWRKEHPYPAGTIHHLVDHIDHIVRVAGVEHVGLGSDYDGITKTPVQLEDVSCYPYITQELLNRGYSREDVLKILGGNLLRVMRKAEATANGLAKQP